MSFLGFLTRSDLAKALNIIADSGGRQRDHLATSLHQMERRIMAKLDDQLAAVTGFLTSIAADVSSLNDEVGELGNAVTKIGADTQSLLDQIAAMPRNELSPQQQAALDNIANLAQSVANSTATVKDAAASVVASAKALDDKVPDPAAKPAEVVKAAEEAQKADDTANQQQPSGQG